MLGQRGGGGATLITLRAKPTPKDVDSHVHIGRRINLQPKLWVAPSSSQMQSLFGKLKVAWISPAPSTCCGSWPHLTRKAGKNTCKICRVNFKSRKRKERSYIQGNNHKIINGFLKRNISGQESMRWHIQNIERKKLSEESCIW